MTDRDVINRCTRDGHTSWQSVSRQLGRSVDSVRGQYDPTYLRSHLWAPTRSPEPAMAMPENEDDTSSPYAKTDPLPIRIIAVLKRGGQSAATIASLTGTTLNSAQVRLTAMKHEGIVKHSERIPYTWTLAEIGQRKGSGEEVAA